MSEFKSVGDALRDMNITGLMAEYQAKRNATRAERLAKHGWAEHVNCDECGDTGTNPETRRVCWCEAGQLLEHKRTMAANWPKIVPPRFVDFTIAGHPNYMASENVKAWVQHGYPVGRNLVLVGSVGTGKTGLAVGAMREVYRDGAKVMFGTLLSYLDMMRPGERGEPAMDVDRMAYVDLLVIDDIGTERMTEWAAERLMAIIDARHTHVLPTIVTTNLPLQPKFGEEGRLNRPRTLQDTIGERAFSRLMSDVQVTPVAGKDLRREAA